MKQIIKEGHYKGIYVITQDQVIEAANQLLEDTK